MAKLTLTMQLEVPGIEAMSDAELRQLLFDSVTNRLEGDYLRAILRVVADRNFQEQPEVMEHTLSVYREWAKIIHNATWEFQRQ